MLQKSYEVRQFFMKSWEAILLKKVNPTLDVHLQCLMRNIEINSDIVCES